MKQQKRHILVIRLSALGDIAISVPLLKEYARKNPQVEFSILSMPFTAPLFAGIDNLHFIPFDLPKDKRGLLDVLKFTRTVLKPLGFTDVADIHNVIRTKAIRTYFRFCGVNTKFIDKGRAEKKALVSEKNKRLVQLKSSMRRYEEVFVALGLQYLGFADSTTEGVVAEAKDMANRQDSQGVESIGKEDNTSNRIEAIAPDKAADRQQRVIGIDSGKTADRQQRVIGIAPFAQHKGKCWPLEFVEQTIALLAADPANRIILFGGGAKEVEILEGIAAKFENVESAAGKYKMKQEQEVMKGLDVMVSMDSANMHLASLVGTPVVSIWGATHPYAGFYGWGQKMENALQVDLPCRPCSIYGNKPCSRGDYACLNMITPQQVVKKIHEVTAFMK